MKNIFISSVLLFIVSCNNNHPTEKHEELEIEQVKIDTHKVENLPVKEVIDSSVFTNTDLNKLNLFGKIKSVSTHEFDIDENGDEYGMGGTSEYLTFNMTGFQTVFEKGGCCGANNEEIEYRYNDNNQLTHRIFRQSEAGDAINKDGPYEKKEKYFYNNQGVLVKIKIAGFDQVLAEEITFYFDDNNRIIKKEFHNISKNESSIVNYKYSDHQTTELYFNKSRELDYKIVLIFNASQLLTSKELHLSSGDIQQQKFTYKFDDQGNWISKETKYRYVLDDGTKEEWRNSVRTTRTITYF